MTPSAGTQVKALPSGSTETLTPEQLLDLDPYEGSKEEITGPLTIQKVPADYDFNAPAYTLYTVNGIPVDKETIQPIEEIKASAEIALTVLQPIAAGLAIIALDTNRVLLLQRAITENDPASGKWEFPGGTIDPGEEPYDAALREWCEETGHKPPAGVLVTSWLSPNGVYQGFVFTTQTESNIEINLDHEDRHVLNPDDPDGDQIETIAWWNIDDLPGNPALRDETQHTPWNILRLNPTQASSYFIDLLRIKASTHSYANECHGPDGKFCETHNTTHEKAATPKLDRWQADNPNQEKALQRLKDKPSLGELVVDGEKVKDAIEGSAPFDPNARAKFNEADVENAPKTKETIDTNSIIATKNHLKRSAIAAVIHALDDPKGPWFRPGYLPIVIKQDGKNYLWDGHHRIEGAILLNQPTTQVEVAHLKKNQTKFSFVDLLRNKANTHTCSNECHDPSTGKFCPGTGAGRAGGPSAPRVKVDPADIRKWAKENGHQIGDRGRIPADIIAAHKKANRAKPQQPTTPKPETKTPATTPTPDFQSKLKEAKGSLSDDLKGIKPAEYSLQGDAPGNKFLELEAQTRKTGEVIHNEITRRLEEGGIKEPKSLSPEEDAKLRTQFQSIQKEITKTEPDYTDMHRVQRETWGPNNYYIDEEHKAQLAAAMEKAFPGVKAKVQVLRAQMKTVNDTLIEDRKTQADYATAYRGAALQVLSEARNGAYGNFDFKNVKASNPGVKAALIVAGTVYPDDWVIHSDRSGSITGKKGGRGLHQESHTSDGVFNSTITVDAQPGPASIAKNAFYPVAVHEIGHRMEVLRPHIMAMEWTFWHRRQEGETPSKLQKMQPGYGYKGDEMAVKDKYIDPYIGKVYNNSPKSPMESFQMGVQYLFGGSKLITRDKDYTHFILGLLAAG